MYGTPETTPGGKALKFYASVRIDVRRIESIKDGKEATGNRTKVKIVKNKLAPPFRTAEFDIIFGQGISNDLVDLAIHFDIVQKSGSWFSYEGERLGQGRESVKDKLDKEPEFRAIIEDKIRKSAEKAPLEEDEEERTGPLITTADNLG